MDNILQNCYQAGYFIELDWVAHIFWILKSLCQCDHLGGNIVLFTGSHSNLCSIDKGD